MLLMPPPEHILVENDPNSDYSLLIITKLDLKGVLSSVPTQGFSSNFAY